MEVPDIYQNGAQVRVIAGSYLGRQGAFTGKYVPATYLDVSLPARQEWSYNIDPEQTLFVYLFSVHAVFDPNLSTEHAENLIAEKQAILFGQGEQFWVLAADQDLRFILMAARPLHEPIAWGGPIVMNTREELDLAFWELDHEQFIKDHAER